MSGRLVYFSAEGELLLIVPEVLSESAEGASEEHLLDGMPEGTRVLRCASPEELAAKLGPGALKARLAHARAAWEVADDDGGVEAVNAMARATAHLGGGRRPTVTASEVARLYAEAMKLHGKAYLAKEDVAGKMNITERHVARLLAKQR